MLKQLSYEDKHFVKFLVMFGIILDSKEIFYLNKLKKVLIKPSSLGIFILSFS